MGLWQMLRRGPFLASGALASYRADFGFPDEIAFADYREMYRRNGLAQAAVKRLVSKTWQTLPWLGEADKDGDGAADDSAAAGLTRARFDELRVWRALQEADARSLVCGWSALVIRVADGADLAQPLGRVAGLDGLVELMPVWADELKVTQWQRDPAAPDYGKPVQFSMTQGALGDSALPTVRVHASRVFIWSADGTMGARSALEPGWDDLLTMRKVSASGGEGFWRNAKSLPAFEIDPEADLESMAANSGVSLEDFRERFTEEVRSSLSSFGKALLMSGMKASPLPVSLPQPEQFYTIPLQSFAASIPIPIKILVGSQTGERASTEDAREWALTCESRRVREIVPLLQSLLARLVDAGVLAPVQWALDWDDLTEETQADKLARAKQMADANQAAAASGELVFLPSEIRDVAGFAELDDSERILVSPLDRLEALG